LWSPGDPIERLSFGIMIHKFYAMVERGKEVTIDEEFIVEDLRPFYSYQEQLEFEIYYTDKSKHEVTYCDDPDMKRLGDLLIDLPDVHLGYKRLVTFKLSFGSVEIKASAFNQNNGQSYQVTFDKSDM